MSQKTVDEDDSTDYDEARREMMTTKGVERSTLDMEDDDHALSGMDSKRKAPVEAVAKNVVDRYDNIKAFYREYMANAHTACIQRAKYELREAGIDDVDYNDVREVLERAKEEVGYEPAIVVKRNENPEEYALKIEDNGIGITSQTAYAIRDIGLSGWHDDETTNGQFGQGSMAGFLPVDHYGEFDMTTWSVKSDENYRARWKLTDLDHLPGKRDSYGTTFTFPYFTDEAQEIDDYEAVREYAEGMIVPVIYEHYDEDGRQDGNKSDDWGASYVEDRYADDSPTIVYEDRFAKAVWSPDNPDSWDTNLKTWCGYQPIDRNDSGIGINSYSMPSGFDIRVKVEDGSIVHVPEDSDQSLIGKVPVSKNRYEHLDDDQKDGHVVRSEVPDDAIIAPEPTDDRDRFESKHVSDFMRYYAGELEDLLKDRVADVIEDLDGLEDLPDLDDTDRRFLLIGIEEYITTYAQNDAERVADDVEEEFGVTIDPILATNINVVKSEFGSNVSDKFAGAVGRMKQARLSDVDDEEEFGSTVRGMADEVSHASPDYYGRQTKTGNRKSKEVWKVVEEAGDDGTVYMAKTLSCRRKMKLAWELHEDNQTVVVSRYDKWEDMFGWEKLKNLPARNFDDHFEDHDFDEDWLDEWDPARGGGASGPSVTDGDVDGRSFDDERAKRKAVKVRYGTGSGKYDTVRGEDLFEALDEDDGSFKIGYSGPFDTLILYRSTEGHRAGCGSHFASKKRGIAYARVSNYVFEYLKRAERALTEDEYLDRERNKQVEFDWTAEPGRQSDSISNLDERDVLIRGSEDLFDPIFSRGLKSEFIDALEDRITEYGADELRSITYVESSKPSEYYEVLHRDGNIDSGMKPMMIGVDTGSFHGSTSFGYGYKTVTKVDLESVFFDCVLPDLDRSAPEWRSFNPSMDDDELIEALEELQDHRGFRSTDPDDAPDWIDSTLSTTSRDEYWVQETVERIDLITDYCEQETED